MGQPSIKVYATELGQLPGYDPHYHLTIVVDDGQGNQTYYRGGPENSPGGSGQISGASGGSSGSGSSSGSTRSSGSGSPSISPFGDIVTSSGKYGPGDDEYRTDAILISQTNIAPQEVAKVKKYLAGQMQDIEAANIDYFPTGPNSNSVAGTAMRNLGVDLQVPKGMWIPGIEQQLVDRNGKVALANTTTIASEPTTFYALTQDALSQLTVPQAAQIVAMAAKEGNPGDSQASKSLDSMAELMTEMQQEKELQQSRVEEQVLG
jgi:hypothetical protein